MDKALDGDLSRRELLGATAVASLGATSGCVQRVRSIVGRDSAESVALTVNAPSADADRIGTLIARHLVTNLEAAGISVTLNVLPLDELYRQVLLNRDFELFVARGPAIADPHEYRGLLYSTFFGEPGLQNPSGMTNMEIDSLIERQGVASGSERQEVVGELLHKIVETQPFTIVGFPDEIRAVRSDKFNGWGVRGLRDPFSYFALERASDVSETAELTLQLGMIDTRPTQNLNPLAVEHRRHEPFTTLLYDPLARRIDDTLVPWLGSEWEFETQGNTQELTVTLRSGLVWHDETPIQAADVAFSFKFLKDTSLGSLEQTVPAPRFRSWTSVIDTVRAIDDRTVRFTLDNVSPEVGRHLLTIPILPEHVWRDRTDAAQITGLGGSENVTEALVTSNTSPVGSGPVELAEVRTDESLRFELFDDHFLQWSDDRIDEIPEHYHGRPAFDAIELEVVPSNETAVELVVAGDFDATATPLDPREAILQRIGDSPGVSVLVEPSSSPYQIGYNTSKKPFSNPYLRRLVAQLIDKRFIAETIFDGYGSPATTHFEQTHWAPESLVFEDRDPVHPFLGTNGNVNTERARDAFREHGYEYDGDTLVFR